MGLHGISQANPNRLAQLDAIIVPKAWLHKISDAKSLPLASLATQHLPIQAVLDVPLRKNETNAKPKMKQANTLKDQDMQNRFASLTEEHLRTQEDVYSCENVNSKQQAFKDAFVRSSAILPDFKSSPHKPWISQATLALLDERIDVRRSKDTVR